MNSLPVSMLIKRLAAIPVSIFAIATLTFWLVRLSGSNAAAALAGEYADPAAIAAVERSLGLDQDLWSQYVVFLGELLRGSLGTSYFSQTPVSTEIFSRLPLDLTIGLLALVVAVILGVVMGALAAYTRDRWPDGVVRVSVSALQSIPDYVLSLAAIYVFFFILRWLPAPVGQLPIGGGRAPHLTGVVALDSLFTGSWGTFWPAVRQLVLPVLGMGIVLSAVFAKVTRSSFASILSSPQIQYAKACGLRPWRVLRSAFSVSRSAILTTVAIIVGVIVGGGSIQQKIFTLDGAAAYSVDAIFKMDLPAIQGIVIVFGSVTVIAFLLIDIVILITDPRVRQRS